MVKNETPLTIDEIAEEVAESIRISSPTLHKHLRRAEEHLLEDLFDADDDADRSITGWDFRSRVRCERFSRTIQN